MQAEVAKSFFIYQIVPGYKITSDLGPAILCELVASAARSVVLERRISRVDNGHWHASRNHSDTSGITSRGWLKTDKRVQGQAAQT